MLYKCIIHSFIKETITEKASLYFYFILFNFILLEKLGSMLNFYYKLPVTDLRKEDSVLLFFVFFYTNELCIFKLLRKERETH